MPVRKSIDLEIEIGTILWFLTSKLRHKYKFRQGGDLGEAYSKHKRTQQGGFSPGD